MLCPFLFIVTLNLFQGLYHEMLKQVQHDETKKKHVTLDLFQGL